MWQLRCIATGRPPDVASLVLDYNYLHNAPAYKFNTSAASFGYHNSHILSGVYIFAIGRHLPAVLAIFSLRMHKKGISDLQV